MKPDTRKCQYSFLVDKPEVPPTIMFTPKALKFIRAMVECHHEEVGMEGIVTEEGDAYVVTEVFYPKHCLVSSATCEISPEGEIELAQTLIDAGRFDDVSRVRFWCHSHHTMGTSPSGQDDTQALKKMNDNAAYIIRAIANKEGEMSVSFFDHRRQMKFENVKWSIRQDFDAMLKDVADIIVAPELSPAAKISSIQFAVSNTVSYNDEEYDKMKEIIENLKKVNLPDKVVHHNGYNGRVTSEFDFPQQNMFEGFPNNNGRNFSPHDFYDRGKPRITDKRSSKKRPKDEELLTTAQISDVIGEKWGTQNGY